MRKTKAEAAETRKRIVETAARAFREQGVEGAGLNAVMAAAGLTHGGFYRHFQSKGQLVAEAAAVAADASRQSLVAAIEPAALEHRFEALVQAYLSPAHRDAPGEGCLFAALAGELAREDAATRETATRCLQRLADLIAAQRANPQTEAARDQALAATATLVGAVALSRVAVDPDLSDRILKAAAQDLLARESR